MEEIKNWCKYCGCHKDNKIICSSGRHSYTATKEENRRDFPHEILADYDGNITHDGKTPLITTPTT